MPEYLAPGVYFEPADRSLRGVTALRTDVAGFVGIAERGPLDEPVLAESFAQFRSVFGDFLAGGFLAYAAKAFFDNGGRRAWFVRVASDEVKTESDPAAAISPEGEGKFSPVASVEGFVAGAAVTVSQGAELRRTHLLAAVDPLRRRLVWERPLEREFDLSLPMDFAAGPASACVEVAGGDGRPTLSVAASTPGGWGNGLAVRVSRSNAAATVTRTVAQPLNRSASFVADVVGFIPGTLVQLFQGGPAVREAWRVVTEADVVRRLLTWDQPLPPTFDLVDLVARPISLESVEFGLTVLRDGRVAEVFSDLSLVASHPRYIETATRDSTWIRAKDLQRGAAAPSPFPDRLPDPSAGDPTPGAWRLEGGRDGIAALAPRHLTGGDPGEASERKRERRRGLRALGGIDEVALVAIPDALIRATPARLLAPRPAPPRDPCLPCEGRRPLWDPCAPGAGLEAALDPCSPCPPPDPPPGPSLVPRLVERTPGFTREQVFDVQQALVAHCERLRDRVAILDPPLIEEADLALAEIQAWRRRFDTSYAALYHPWVGVYDPRQPRAVAVRAVPPSGHVAGICARTDLTVGVHKAPANEELAWAQSLTQEIGAAEQELLNPMGINCIRTFPGRGLRVYGARTLSSDTPWRYVPVRRLLLMIAKAIEESMAWAVFEPHDVFLRQTLSLAIGSFLEGLWARGALAGATPGDAFFVKCDRENNPQEAVDRGELLAEVGVAPTVPAEFVILRVGRTEDALAVDEVKEGGAPWR